MGLHCSWLTTQSDSAAVSTTEAANREVPLTSDAKARHTPQTTSCPYDPEYIHSGQGEKSISQ